MLEERERERERDFERESSRTIFLTMTYLISIANFPVFPNTARAEISYQIIYSYIGHVIITLPNVS